MDRKSRRFVHYCLRPLGWLYYTGLLFHRSCYRRFGVSHRFKIPVISVGNLTWGGTGKTPLVLWLAETLKKEGLRPAVLMRGYGKDELKLFSERQLTVAAGKDRIAGGERMLRSGQYDLFILDDGFQHWPIERDLEIVAINAADPYGNGELIPIGSLREPKISLRRAGVVVLTHADEVEEERLLELERVILKIQPHAKIAWAIHEPTGIFNTLGEAENLNILKMKPYILVSGLGYPESFRRSARELLDREALKEHRFRDHHAFTQSELKRIAKDAGENGAFCLISEKDFLRSRDLFRSFEEFKILKMEIAFLKGEEWVRSSVHRVVSAGTRELLVLSDGKTGHLKQSLGIADLIQDVSPVQKTVEIRYKNKLAKCCLWLAAPLLAIFIRSRRSLFGILDLYLENGLGLEIPEQKDTVIVSGGSSLLPIQYLFKKILRTRAIILMRPRGFYSIAPWDLVIQPLHDGRSRKANVISTLTAFGGLSPADLELYFKEADKNLGLLGKRGISFFIGGNSEGYQFSRESIVIALEHLKAFCHSKELPFFVTVSRRTPRDIITVVKEACSKDPLCKRLVIPQELDVQRAVETMLAVSQIAIVTEESVSMTSEAVRGGRRVVSLAVGKRPLAGKKKAFQSLLIEEECLITATPQELYASLEKYYLQKEPPRFLDSAITEVEERILAFL